MANNLGSAATSIVLPEKKGMTPELHYVLFLLCAVGAENVLSVG